MAQVLAFDDGEVLSSDSDDELARAYGGEGGAFGDDAFGDGGDLGAGGAFGSAADVRAAAAALADAARAADGAAVANAAGSLAGYDAEDLLCGEAWPAVAAALGEALRSPDVSTAAAPLPLLEALLEEALGGAPTQLVEIGMELVGGLGAACSAATNGRASGAGARAGAAAGALLERRCALLLAVCAELPRQALYVPEEPLRTFVDAVAALLAAGVSHRWRLVAADATMLWVARWLRHGELAAAALRALERSGAAAAALDALGAQVAPARGTEVDAAVARTDVPFGVGVAGAMLRSRGGRAALAAAAGAEAAPSALKRMVRLCCGEGFGREERRQATQQLLQTVRAAAEQGASEISLDEVAVSSLLEEGGEGGRAVLDAAFAAEADAPPHREACAIRDPAAAAWRVAEAAIELAAGAVPGTGASGQRARALLGLLRYRLHAPHVARGFGRGPALAGMLALVGDCASSAAPDALLTREALLDVVLSLCASPTGALRVRACCDEDPGQGIAYSRELLRAALERCHCAGDGKLAARALPGCWTEVRQLVEAAGRLAALPDCADGVIAWPLLLAPLLETADSGGDAERLARRLKQCAPPGPGGHSIEMWQADQERDAFNAGGRAWSVADARAAMLLRLLSALPPGRGDGGALRDGGTSAPAVTPEHILEAFARMAHSGRFASERGPFLMAGALLALVNARRTSRSPHDAFEGAGVRDALAAVLAGPTDASSGAASALAAAVGIAPAATGVARHVVFAPMPAHVSASLADIGCGTGDSSNNLLARPLWEYLEESERGDHGGCGDATRVRLSERRRLALIAAGCAEEMVRRTSPAQHGVLEGALAPVGALACAWLDAAFWGVLPWAEVASYAKALAADGPAAAAVWSASAAISLADGVLMHAGEAQREPMVLSAAALPDDAAAAAARADLRAALASEFGPLLAGAFVDRASPFEALDAFGADAARAHRQYNRDR